MKVLVTGGCGFIGSALVRYLINSQKVEVLNLDKLTYAGNLQSLVEVAGSTNYQFVQVDITDRNRLEDIFSSYQPDLVMHLAAESHVDRSIDHAAEFMQTNIIGTYALLETALEYWRQLPAQAQTLFRFHHVSTDEVYGTLGKEGYFTESTSYDPSSPYSASKASSDHLVRAWHRTYGLPIVITNCSNNYGPYQFPEKLIPNMIICASSGRPLPIYGSGENVRDWLFVDDHVQALWLVANQGEVGQTYNIGGNCEKSNKEVVFNLCEILDELLPNSAHLPHKSLVTYVSDRPGHDFRYAIDATKISNTLGWSPQHSFEQALQNTVSWYLNNRNWWNNILNGSYRHIRQGLSTS